MALAQPSDSAGRDQRSARDQLQSFKDEHGEAILAGLSALLIISGWLLERSGNLGLAAPLYVAGYIAGGFYSARDGLTTLIKERDLDVDLLMVVAAIGAASIGYWVDGAILILIFSISGALEGYALRRTGRDIHSLMKMKPETATRLKDGHEERVGVEALSPGDLVLIKAGERIATDGVVVEGHSSVNQAAITGESIPVEKEAGSQVFAGTINGQGTMKIEVTVSAADTLISRLVQMVQEAQSEMPRSQLFIQRFERRYARVVVLGALAMGTLPPFLFDWTWSETVYRAMILLVVASPCALVASTMPAILSGISNATRHGILVKGGMHLETLGDVKVVALDKTGTITYGRPQITDITALGDTPAAEEELLALAASLERRSDHPLARVIVEAAEARGISFEEPSDVQEKPGFGLQGSIGGTLYRIGRPSFMEREGIALDAETLKAIDALERQGKSLAVLASDERALGLFAFQDTLRDGVAQVTERLHRLGVLRVVMLTGDTKSSGEAIAAQAGIDEVHGDLLPEEKVRIVKELSARHGKVAMVGDGVNDAPALAAASVGLAMGRGGTDVALDTADVVFVSDDLTKLPYSIELGRRAKRVVMQNIVFAVSVICLLIAANFLHTLTMPLAVIGHEGSTILVILNGLRLLRGRAEVAA